MCDTQSDPKTAFEKQTVPIIFRELANSSQFDVFVSRLTLVFVLWGFSDEANKHHPSRMGIKLSDIENWLTKTRRQL
jgi:hypothetical protein